MEVFLQYFHSDTTGVLLGSSGAGKSTITNWLLGSEAQRTGQVRENDSDGRHTTTSRELFSLPRGGYLIDTPGMRELDVIFDEQIEGSIFEEISALSLNCQYTDCDHEKSLGCVIQEALLSGVIDDKQLQNYKKLQREESYHATKEDSKLLLEHKRKNKRVHKDYNKIIKLKHSGRESSSET
jgi:ribosome biogenesis GTPase